ncbi:MAG: DEAD/DEAH box helicase family protein [Proteobacteria bacterium]|nr:DEAD/DEAH box helicase family protein [Pseudomonadota bacterium]
MAQDKFDFSQLGKMTAKQEKLPINPIEIFEKLPSLPGTHNDLWRGQTDALKGWDAHRKSPDVLIALNTGAGKTLVGSLIAQSLHNEGVENVVYVCATIDLVKQTSLAAKGIGIQHTTRIEGGFDNDLFETGKAFCITTYQALFSGITTFRGTRSPGAIIFDDAHVAEGMIRDQFSLRISPSDNNELLQSIARVFDPHFLKIDRQGLFQQALGSGSQSAILASPGAVRENSAALAALFANPKVAEQLQFKFPLNHLRDHLKSCAVIFANGECEITPPFLPVSTLPFFGPTVRRVYLSATLQYKTDFVRAFGREPSHVIEPKNDAGNGERLILLANTLGNSGADLIAKTFSASNKILIAVPNYLVADKWKTTAIPPKREDFTNELNKFRGAATGAFVLVSRVDGIDLPHDTCRLMMIDGLPAGGSLLERYLWLYLNMKNLFASRMANRLAQLFGRINRGRNDYGVFFVEGRDVSIWISNDRNVALLPDLLRQQILLGRFVQEKMNIKTIGDVRQVVDLILKRDEGWLAAYGDNIEKGQISAESTTKADQIEGGLLTAAKAEADYIRHSWQSEIVEARMVLEASIEATTRADTRLGGWHNVWLGGCYEAEGDIESAMNSYRRARAQLGVNFVVPEARQVRDGTPLEPLNPFASNVDAIAGLSSDEGFNKEFRKLKASLQNLDGGSTNQMEEATRALGAFLGFTASRPDNDDDVGPDVLWLDGVNKLSLPFELKTDKNHPAQYNKKEIGQAHNSYEWTQKTFGDHKCLGLLIVGPKGICTDEATPNEQMFLAVPTRFVEVRERVFGIIQDVRRGLPLNRRNRIIEKCHADEWRLDKLFEFLKDEALVKLKKTVD